MDNPRYTDNSKTVRFVHETIVANDGAIPEEFYSYVLDIGDAYCLEGFSRFAFIKIGSIGLKRAVHLLPKERQSAWQDAMNRDFVNDFLYNTIYASELCLGPHFAWKGYDQSILSNSVMIWHRGPFSTATRIPRNPPGDK